MARNKAGSNVPLAVLVFRTAMEQKKSISDYADVINVGPISLRQFVYYKTKRPRTTTLESIGNGLKISLDEARRRAEIAPAALPPFSEWLKAQMEGRYTRSALSKATGISDSALKNYITGNTLPEAHQARKIADVLTLDMTEMSEVIISSHVAEGGGELADDDEGDIEEAGFELEAEEEEEAVAGEPPMVAALTAAVAATPPAASAPASSEEDRVLGLWRNLHPQGRRAAMLYMAGLLTEG